MNSHLGQFFHGYKALGEPSFSLLGMQRQHLFYLCPIFSKTHEYPLPYYNGGCCEPVVLFDQFLSRRFVIGNILCQEVNLFC